MSLSIYHKPGEGFFASLNGVESGPFNTSEAAEYCARGFYDDADPTPTPLGEITPDDVQRVSDFAQEAAGNQEVEAEDVRGGPDGWAEATQDDYDAAEEEAREILDDADRVTRVSALIHSRADVVAAVLAADADALFLTRLILRVPFPAEVTQ